MPVLPDNHEGFRGALAGIEAGLAWVRAECPEATFAVTVPGDTLFIPVDLVAHLAERKGNAPMAVAVSVGGLHPVVGLRPVAMADTLADGLARGERQASQFVRAKGAAEVSFPPATIARTSGTRGPGQCDIPVR